MFIAYIKLKTSGTQLKLVEVATGRKAIIVRRINQ